jgi:hypothetical protein
MFNPYAAGGSATPLIAPDLHGSESMLGGANAYGLLPSDLLVSDPGLAGLIANAPAGSSGFMEVMPNGTGPFGFQNTIPGYVMLLLANFGTQAMQGATLNGIPLQTFGFADSVVYGGSGNANLLAGLDPGELFATLVPDVGLSDYAFSDGTGNFDAMLDTGVGGAVFNNAPSEVPEPASLGLLGLGMTVLGMARRSRAGSTAIWRRSARRPL